MRIGLYVDVSNLYFCLYNNMHGKLDYSALNAFIEPLGEVVLRKAYGAQVKDEAASFIQLLERLGFEAYYKQPKYYGAKHIGKADWDVGIAIDIVRDLVDLDMIILATADGDMAPVIQYAKEKGKQVVVIGSNISHELQNIVTKYIEIPESLVIPLGRK